MMFPLVGNKIIKESLENSIRENRVPHAIIIEGDIGTGRHTLADFIAKSAVCDEELKPCGVCKNCRMAEIKSHPDISVIAPEEGKKNIAVAQVKSLREEAFVKPHQANVRVFIMDFADTMNEQSQNAILKILEEPPGNIIFVLIAETKSALLETIISRCVVFSLSAPSFDEAKEYIKQKGGFLDVDIADALEETHLNVGKALRFLSGEGDSKTSAAAKEYIEFLKRQNEWGCISVTAPFEKKRIEADRFLKDLKYYIADAIKKNPEGLLAKKLSAFYTRISIYEKSLITNVNLGLMFSALTADGAKILK